MASSLLSVVVVGSLLIIPGAISQETSTSCPELSIPEGYSCLSSSDCAVLECIIPANNVLVNGTANITLDRCDDPPLVNFRMQWLSDEGSLGLQISFTESGDVLIGEGRIRATVERNLTTLAFSARLVNSTEELYVIPPVVYDINTTECLCTSMEELAEKIHSPIEHDCAATPACDGVTCQLEVLGNTYIIEMDVLSCAQPPGVDVLVKDAMGNPFYSAVIDDNTTQTVPIHGIYVPMQVLLIQHPYSIEVESNLTLPVYGTFTMVPRHSITLDLASCPNRSSVAPPTATPTALPTQPPPPIDAPSLCHTLYNLANATAPALICSLVPSCTELTCEMYANGNPFSLELIVLPRESDEKAHIVYQPLYYESSQEWYVTVGTDMREWTAGEGGTLYVEATATNTTLTLQMKLRIDGQEEIILIPETTISLPSADGCLWWLPAIEDHPQCSYLLDCQGALCLNHLAVDRSSISVTERCADPISVDLTLRDQDNQILLQEAFTKSSVFNFTENDGYLVILRNDTALRVLVFSSFRQDYIYPLIPNLTIPIDQQFCSCQSLVELADKIHSPLEHDCTANGACNGVRCEFDIFGNILYMETILLSCYNPPALETVLEDANNVTLHTNIVSRTGTYIINIRGVELPMHVEIVHHNYSMDVVGTLLTPFGLNVTLIPPHTLFLDRSSCPTAIPPPSTPPLTISPPTFPSPSTPTCQALVDISQTTARDTFVCQVKSTDGGVLSECDSLACRLGVEASNYLLRLEVYPEGGEYVGSVQVTSGGTVLREEQVKGTDSVKVDLTEGDLVFDFQTQGKSLGIKVTLTLDNGVSTELINSQVPLEEQKGSSQRSSSEKLKIGLPVAAVLACIAITVTIVVMVTVWQCKRRRQTRQFEFKPMKFSELNEPSEEPQKVGGTNGGTEHVYEQVDASPPSQ